MKMSGSEPRSLGLLCRLLGRTRQAYYGHLRERERGAAGGGLLVEEVARIRSGQRRIGVRKLYQLTSRFRAEHLIEMGRDRFFDLLREHRLLVRRRGRRRPRTTVSGYWLKRYPNLAKGFKASGANQLWVSDITYVRLKDGFAYLSLITDGYSRKIVGYHLSDDLTARGSVCALRMALKNNPVGEALIHHSDRGIQYYSAGYMKLLDGAGVRVSMSEKSDPLENAIAERVNGILKQEFLEKQFESFKHAKEKVDQAVNIYNHLRPHLSCDMLTPAEAHLRTGELKRHWRNYYSRSISSQAMA